MREHERGVSGHAGQLQESRVRILVAEDVEPLRRYMVRALVLLGYEADGVGTFDQLQKVLEESSPDAVLLDWNLDGRCSSTALASLKRQGLPVVVLTGDPGAVGDIGLPVLSKPVNIEVLQAALEQVM